MTNEEIVEGLKLLEDNMVHFDELQNDKGEWIDVHELLFEAIQALEQQPSDTVSRGVFEQVMWERDVAIRQLKELSYGLGQKVEPCDDAVSRVAVCEIISDIRDCISVEGYCAIIERLKKLPPVTQKYGKWIDYRDEGFVECPYCGHATNCEDDIDELHYCFYCGCRMVDPQESEVSNEKDSN